MKNEAETAEETETLEETELGPDIEAEVEEAEPETSPVILVGSGDTIE